MKVVRFIFALVEKFIIWPGMLLELCWPFKKLRFFRSLAATFVALLWLAALLNVIVIAINGGLP